MVNIQKNNFLQNFKENIIKKIDRPRKAVTKITALTAVDPVKGVYEFAKVYPPQYIPDEPPIINQVEQRIYKDTYPYKKYGGYAFTKEEFKVIMKYDPDNIYIAEMDSTNETIRFLDSKPMDWYRYGKRIKTEKGTIILLKEQYMNVLI